MALLGFVGFLSMSSQRMCINVAMDCMLNHTALSLLQQQQQQQPSVKQQSQQREGGEMHPYTSSYLHQNVTASYNTSKSLFDDNEIISNVDRSDRRPCAGIPDIYVLNPSQFHYFHVSINVI
jgi:hypothetical protein